MDFLELRENCGHFIRLKGGLMRVWIRRNLILILIALVGFAAMNAIFLSSAFRGGDIAQQSAGLLGDFVGGYVGTFLSLISVLALLATLRNQKDSTKLLAFEGKYFELIRLHRENVAEMHAKDVHGRRIFIFMIKEYRLAVEFAKQSATKFGISFSSDVLVEVGCICLFFGVGPTSSRMLEQALSHLPAEFVRDLIARITAQRTDPIGFEYTPLDGQQSRLGHYFRHLYQAIKYVDQQDLPWAEKYDYVKTLRAQLSNHEQALLLLNSRSPFGKEWWNAGYIKKYALVKNLPQDFFEKAELDLEVLFGDHYFEWQERKNRSSI